MSDLTWRDPSCVFCDPSALPEQVPDPDGHPLWSGLDGYGLFRVFEPLAPVTPGHLLVVPVHHTPHASAHPWITAGTAHVAARVAARYEAANIITSIGEAATQSIGHLHLHVVPRHHGDGLPLPWTPQQEDDLAAGWSRPSGGVDSDLTDAGFLTDNALCVAADERADVYQKAGVDDAGLAKADAAFLATVERIVAARVAAAVEQARAEGDALRSRIEGLAYAYEQAMETHVSPAGAEVLPFVLHDLRAALADPEAGEDRG